MKRSIRLKAGVIIAVTVICIYGIIGLPESRNELIANFKKNIHLGLDLRGGTLLVMEIQLQDVFKSFADDAISHLRLELDHEKIRYASIDRNDPQRVKDADQIEVDVIGVPSDSSSPVRRIIDHRFPGWTLAALNSTDYRLNIQAAAALRLKHDTITNTIATIERRISGLGLTEATVQPTGRGGADPELLVELPGVDDPTHVKQVLRTRAMFEWDEVADGPFVSSEEATAACGGALPRNTKLVPTAMRDSRQLWYFVSLTPVIRGTDIRDAHVAQVEPGRWDTEFVLSQEAAKPFESYTEANIDKRAAIVVDGQVMNAPFIQSRIGDSGRISGAVSEEEAIDLALNLRTGSLPARIVYLEERTVGPSLGADSIREGLRAGIVGLVAVVFCMLLYYRQAGINATLGILLNAIILIAALSYFGATLTLPGIAGIILTIGMGADSNVLIFERIREELRSGKAVAAAVHAGFRKAFPTIIDTHITAIVSCACLFIFGTGPVKGFAVTLVIGLIANVFTALFVSKTIFDWELSRNRQFRVLSI